MKRFQLLLSISLLSASMLNAQEVTISNGLKLSADGPVQLVFNDMSLVNYGQFKVDNGTVVFTGNSGNRTYVGGNVAPMFYHFTLDRGNSDLQLENRLVVSGNLTLLHGNIDLGHSSIDLGSTGRIEGESRYARITGKDGGFIRTTTDLNSPQQLNPGNLGLQLTSDKNLGQTTIIRGHVQQVNDRGELSIARYYEVQPQFANILQAQVVANFLDVESANANTNEIRLWSSRDGGGSWNAVTNNNNTYVLNESVNSQPLRLTYFTGHNNAIAGSILQLYPNPVTTRFTLAFTYPKQEQVIINLYNEHGQLLESRKVIPFNGLNKVDWDVSKYPGGNYQLKFVGAELRSLSFTKQ